MAMAGTEEGHAVQGGAWLPLVQEDGVDAMGDVAMEVEAAPVEEEDDDDDEAFVTEMPEIPLEELLDDLTLDDTPMH